MIAFPTPWWPIAELRPAPYTRLREGFHCSREVRLYHNQYFLARAEHYGPWGIGPAVLVDEAELSPAKFESSAI